MERKQGGWGVGEEKVLWGIFADFNEREGALEQIE
jgi:hypothetical protein